MIFGKENKDNEFWKLSEQAKMTIVLVLQKGITFQMDVSDLIGKLEFFQDRQGNLSCANPPFVPAPKLNLDVQEEIEISNE